MKPLDMQISVSKLTNIADMKSNQQNAREAMSFNVAKANKQETYVTEKKIKKTHKDERSRNNDDAKDEGKNKYLIYTSPKDKKKNKNQNFFNHSIDYEV